MLLEFIFGGTILIGNVDLAEEDYAIVEYFYDQQLSYRIVRIDKNFCIPYEGQVVIFNDNKIIGCKSEQLE